MYVSVLNIDYETNYVDQSSPPSEQYIYTASTSFGIPPGPPPTIQNPVQTAMTFVTAGASAETENTENMNEFDDMDSC